MTHLLVWAVTFQKQWNDSRKENLGESNEERMDSNMECYLSVMPWCVTLGGSVKSSKYKTCLKFLLALMLRYWNGNHLLRSQSRVFKSLKITFGLIDTTVESQRSDEMLHFKGSHFVSINFLVRKHIKWKSFGCLWVEKKTKPKTQSTPLVLGQSSS